MMAGFNNRWGRCALVALLAMLACALPVRAWAAPIATDRWVELDLYWFDAKAPERSAAQFWDRYAPLYRNVGGHRGVILNIGFTVNYVMTFCALDQPIALPGTSGQELGAKYTVR